MRQPPKSSMPENGSSDIHAVEQAQTQNSGYAKYTLH